MADMDWGVWCRWDGGYGWSGRYGLGWGWWMLMGMGDIWDILYPLPNVNNYTITRKPLFKDYQLFTFSIFLNIYSNHHDCCRYSKEVHLIGRSTFIINVILFLIDGFMFLIGSKTWHNPLIWLLFYFDNSYVTIKVTYLKWIWSLISRLFFFSICVFFHNHSQITGLQGKGWHFFDSFN